MEIAAWVQAFGSIVSALAAVAMWKATIKLIEVTRELTWASVQPRVGLDLRDGVLANAEDATARIINSSPFPVDNLTVHFSALYDRVNEIGEVMTIGRALGSEKAQKIDGRAHWELGYWEYAKQAIKTKADVFEKAPNSGPAVLSVAVEFDHGITGMAEHFEERFSIEFSESGELETKRIWSSKPGPMDRLILKRVEPDLKAR